MNILTFDIEDWWVYEHYKLGNPSDYLHRLNWYLNEILDLLDERNFQATFFCLGEVAAKYPEVIKKIHTRGHHIGCHSFSHKFFGDATPEEVHKDTVKALAVLEDIIGEKVIAYRAPAFSITEKNKWVFEILADNGIEYDCSIFPASRGFGGFPGFKFNTPMIIKSNGSVIKELPVSTINILNYKISYSGGGYFRLFPYWLTKSIMKQNNYVMTYFHIKDFDKDQQRTYRSFEGESAILRYIKKYYGLKNSFIKFSKFVSDFNFINIKKADTLIDWKNVPQINL